MNIINFSDIPIEYLSKVFDEIQLLFAKDKLFNRAKYARGQIDGLDKELKKLSKDTVTLDTYIDTLVKAEITPDGVYSSQNIPLIQLKGYTRERTDTREKIDEGVVVEYLGNKKSVKRADFVTAVRSYNSAVEREQDRIEKEDERSGLEKDLKEALSQMRSYNIGLTHKPRFNTIETDTYPPIPKDAAQNFEALPEETQENVIAQFNRVIMEPNLLSRQLTQYPRSKDYRVLKAYFNKLAITLNTQSKQR